MIRVMKVDIVKLADGIMPGTKEGDHLLSFPGGVQFIVPQSVIDNLDPENDETPNPLPVGPVVMKPNPNRFNVMVPEPTEKQPEDLTTRICIECGNSSKHIMPSGRCHQCAQVKCPTCSAPVKRADMMGQYCPTCLPRNKG